MNYIALARDIATAAGIDPALFCAVIEQESNWNPWATRFEPLFLKHYVAPLRVRPSEAIARSTSWGLCQTMGQTARDNGFDGQFLAQLCDPETGMTVGARYLKKLLDKNSGNVTAALLNWNGGANKSYAAQVMARIEKYREDKKSDQ